MPANRTSSKFGNVGALISVFGVAGYTVSNVKLKPISVANGDIYI